MPGDAGANNVYNVVVSSSDGTNTVTQAVAVTVTNANEAPAITSNGGGPTASLNVAENGTAVTTVTASDPDAGASLTYSIVGGVDAGRFSIGPSNGVLVFQAPPNFESPTDIGADNVYDVQVQVTDGTLTSAQTLTVTVTNTNEAPTITSAVTASVQENGSAVMTVTATDPDAATTLTYGIAGGVDAALFQIDPNSGALSFVSAPDREAPADAGANNVYDVRVSVSDGTLTATRDVAVTVTDSNDTAPQITSDGGGATAAVSVAENTTAVTTVQAIDPDLGPALTYSIAGGADAAAFVIDASSGALTFVAAPDFELPSDAGGDNVYDVVVRVSDGIAVDTQSLAVTITDVLGFSQTVSTPSTTLAGGPEADTLNGVASDNLLHGNGGEDLLTSGLGGDTLDGDAGFDSVTYMGSAAGVTIGLNGAAGTGGNAAGDVLVNVETIIGSIFDDSLAGDGNSNVLAGFSGADTLAGGAGDDALYGMDGNDLLDGGQGADVMNGGDGNDIYVVDTAGDVVTEGASAGTDEVRTALTAYTLGSNVENLTYTGGANFSGTGNGENNSIIGGTGADTLDGGAGVDWVSYFESGEGGVTISLAGGTGSGGNAAGDVLIAVENLTGAQYGANSLVGNSGANTLVGGSGADTLDGGAGNDGLFGSSGNDIYIVDAAGDVVTEGSSAGTDEVRTALTAYTLGTFVENLTYTGGANFSGTGNGENNSIIGGTGADTLDGLAGADTLVGGQGDDVYVVDSPSDRVWETFNGGNDTFRTNLTTVSLASYDNDVEYLIYTGSSNFSGSGNGSDNVLTGGAGNDTLQAVTGNDTLVGGAGADVFYRLSGIATVSYATSADGVTVNLGLGTFSGGDAAGDQDGAGFSGLIGSGSADQLTVGSSQSAIGGGGNDTLAGGGSGNNTLDGGDGHDQLYGWGGSSLLFGGNGNDLLVADQGDTMSGGDGADTMVSSADADSFDGGAGRDLLSYAASFGPVTVNLATGSASGGDAAGDVFANMEGVIGSGGNDVLAGGSLSPFEASGGAGNDTILSSNVMGDTLVGDAGDDYIFGSTDLAMVAYGFDGDDSFFLTIDPSHTINSTFYGGDGHDKLIIGANQSIDDMTISDLVGLVTNVEEIDLTQDGITAALTDFRASDAVSILGTSGPGNTLTLDLDAGDSFSIAAGEFVSTVGNTHTFYAEAQLTNELARVTVT